MTGSATRRRTIRDVISVIALCAVIIGIGLGARLSAIHEKQNRPVGPPVVTFSDCENIATASGNVKYSLAWKEAVVRCSGNIGGP